jgi:hypothetical protein
VREIIEMVLQEEVEATLGAPRSYEPLLPRKIGCIGLPWSFHLL